MLGTACHALPGTNWIGKHISLIHLYKNEEKRLKMGKKARRIAEEQFDRPKSYKKIEEIIKTLLTVQT